MTDSQSIDFASARSQIYLLLAAAFDGDVEELSAAMDADVFRELADVIPEAPTVEVLGPDSLDPSTLRRGHDALFVVPGPHFVPPFASGHVSEPPADFESDSIHRAGSTGGELLGESAGAVAATYEQFGFTPSLGSEFPDSLPALLEFVGALAAAESVAESDDVVADLRTVQVTFVESQLQWLDSFTDSVEAKDTAEGAFAELAAFTRAFVNYDREQLTAMGHPPSV